MCYRLPTSTFLTCGLVLCVMSAGCNKDNHNNINKITGPSPQLSVSTVAPAVGSALGATRVTISGTGFQSGARVSFGDPAPGAVVIDSRTITVDTPAHQVGAVDVVVVNPDGTSRSLNGGFRYEVPLPAPSVMAVAPAAGTTLGGASIELTGTGFRPGAAVTLDRVSVAAILYQGTLYVSATPAHPAGPVTVVVTNPDGQTGALVEGYTFVDPDELDFDGEWLGGTGPEWATEVRFTIRNNVVVSASCADVSVIPVSQAPVVSGGAFSIVKNNIIIMTGRILSDITATGRINSGSCSDDVWIAGRSGR